MKKLLSYRGRHVRRRHPVERFLSVLSLVLLLAFFASGAMALKGVLQMRREQDAFAQLTETVRQVGNTTQSMSLAESTPFMNKTQTANDTGAVALSACGTAYAVLEAQKPDFAAGLYEVGTNNDFPGN